MRRGIKQYHVVVGICGLLFVGALATLRWSSSAYDRVDSSSPQADTQGLVVSPGAGDRTRGPRGGASLDRAAAPAKGRAPDDGRRPVEILKDRSIPVRERIRTIQEVARNEGPEGFEALVEVYRREPRFAGRHLLTKAIADTKDPRAVDVLVGAATRERSVEVRRLAVRGLEKFPQDSRSVLTLKQAAVSDRDRFVRRNAIVSLVRMLGDGAAGFLESTKRRERDPEVLALVNKSLEKMGR